MNPWPDLRAILHGLRWTIIGGVATRAYMPERMTKDLDILVGSRRRNYRSVEQPAKSLAGWLCRLFVAVAGRCGLDVLFGRYRWLNKAFTQIQTDMAGYPVMSLPFLVLLKMAANRGRDVGDLSTMLGWATDDALNQIRAVVARYAPEDCDDLESLIFIGQKEREIPPGA